MSIKSAADLVRSQGRYGDTELMHVNPQEIAALQTIAQAGGKSLSVNPETGLPEAFDLGAALPAIAGTVVGSAVGMPWLGAAIGGLGTYATTGSLERGLMAGIGAFGGASLGASLGAAGAGATTGAAGAGAGTSGVAGGALGTSIGSTSVGAGAGIGGSTIPSVAQIGTQAASLPTASLTAPLTTAPTSAALGTAGTGLGPTLQAAQTGALQGAGTLGPTMQAAQAAQGPLTAAQNFAQMPIGDRFSAIGKGIGQLVSDPSATWQAMGSPTMDAAMMAAPILGGAYADEPDYGSPEAEADIRQYDWDPVGRRFVKRPVVSAYDYSGPQRSVFAYAEGGEVEEGVSDANRSQIARMYREYLMREPDQEGLDYYTSRVNQGIMTMADVQNAIKASAEAMGLRSAGQIEAAYRDALGVSPDQLTMQSLQNQMQAGMTPEQMRSQIMASPEAAGIRAASQQRVQAFSPPPQAPMTPQMGTTPAQQMGIGMIPNRYQAPVTTPSPGVADYNQLLANRANYEYTQMPMPEAVRPRTPAEMQRVRDQQLLGQQMRLQNIQQGAAQAAAAQEPEKVAPTSNNDNNRYDIDVHPMFRNRTGDAYAKGGITSIKNTPKFQAGGEMESDAFIVPADVVSALGNGSTSAGVDVLNQYLGMAMPIEGEGDGLSDDVPATIEGEQPARVADGEVYIPAEVVAMLGEGNPDKGAAKLYSMLDKIRESAHGKKQQQKEVEPEKVMPV